VPQTPHSERHFNASDRVRDIVIGMADGLTVPFALAAGLTGAVGSNGLVITAGLAEIAAGSIAMGLGGYLAARSDAEHYASERVREQIEVQKKPDEEAAEVVDVLASYGLPREKGFEFVGALKERPDAWVDFMMRFELGLEKPEPHRARISAATIAGSYIAGGLIPLFPYFFISSSSAALGVSVLMTLIALTLFGYVKGRFTGSRPVRAAAQTVLVGGLAAAAAFGIARAIAG